MSPRFFALATVLASLVCAAPASAAKITYGSDLTQNASDGAAHSHPEDWAAFPTAVSAPGGLTVPRQGEVAMVQLKGYVQHPAPTDDAKYAGKYPGFEFHIVVMRPLGGGKYKLIVSTVDMPVPYLPKGTAGDQVTTLNLQDYFARICVVPGDVVAIATSGGFGGPGQGFPDDFFVHGYPVQMFARQPNSSYGLYEKQPSQGNFFVGDTVDTSSEDDTELLMRVTIGTGADARWTCRTKSEQGQNLPNPGTTVPTPTPAPGATPSPTATASSLASVPKPKGAPKVHGSTVKIPVSCAGPTACAGLLSLSNNSTVYGTKGFSLVAKKTTALAIKLNSAAKKRMKKGHGKVTVKARVETAAGVHSRRFIIKKA
jgi:hypothetical protein